MGFSAAWGVFRLPSSPFGGGGPNDMHPALRERKTRKRRRRTANFTRDRIPYTLIIPKFNINFGIFEIRRSFRIFFCIMKYGDIQINTL
jgi:hypothetical protein